MTSSISFRLNRAKPLKSWQSDRFENIFFHRLVKGPRCIDMACTKLHTFRNNTRTERRQEMKRIECEKPCPNKSYSFSINSLTPYGFQFRILFDIFSPIALRSFFFLRFGTVFDEVPQNHRHSTFTPEHRPNKMTKCLGLFITNLYKALDDNNLFRINGYSPATSLTYAQIDYCCFVIIFANCHWLNGFALVCQIQYLMSIPVKSEKNFT